MKLFQSQYLFLGLIPVGFVLTVIAGNWVKPNPGEANPLAIRQSGFGMTLARLSQTSVNRVWHMGVEKADAHGNEPGACDDPHCNHDHGETHDAHHAGQGQSVEKAHEFLSKLRQGKNTRTNRYSLTERHRLTSSKKIENTLRKSYQLDPTNYGVYNDYYLFLTIHDLGSTEESRRRAVEISRLTIQEAYSEKENPEAFLTAASAGLNLFFAEQGQRRIEGKTLPREDVRRYGDLITECISVYEKIRRRRIILGTWKLISPARRAEIEERARFARKTQEQFSVMLKRMPPETKSPWLVKNRKADNPSKHQHNE